jgi:hypothetical protein
VRLKKLAPRGRIVNGKFQFDVTVMWRGAVAPAWNDTMPNSVKNSGYIIRQIPIRRDDDVARAARPAASPVEATFPGAKP